MSKSPLIKLHLDALAAAETVHNNGVARADRILEARKHSHTGRIAVTADQIADAQSRLELYDGLEQERMSRQTRTELASLEEQHRDNVDGADAALGHAVQDYLDSLARAASDAQRAYSEHLAKNAAQAAGKKLLPVAVEPAERN